MIVMEGMMLVPPERGTIIGRAIWKVSLHPVQSVCLFSVTSDNPAPLCRPRYRPFIQDAERDACQRRQFRESSAQKPEVRFIETEFGGCYATGAGGENAVHLDL